MAQEISDIELDIITKNKNEEIIFRNVTFASNSFIIDSSSYYELIQLAEISGAKIINKVISPNSIDIKKLGFVKKLIIKKNNIEIK